MRSMVNNSSLLKSLWGKALKTVAYILNRVSSKAVNKTLMNFGLAKGQALNTRILGCPAEVRPYTSHERKLDSRTISCYFFGYVERSRGYKFYDPTLRSFFETGNARFIEEVEFGTTYSNNDSAEGDGALPMQELQQ